jgi:hypothetical protein
MAMGSGASKVNQGNNYKSENKHEKNRVRRLNRHLKKHPNDEAARTAVSNTTFRRSAANTKGRIPNGVNSFARLLPKFLRGTYIKIATAKPDRRDHSDG